MMMNKTGTRTRGPITMEVCGAYRQTQNTKGRALSRHQSSQIFRADTPTLTTPSQSTKDCSTAHNALMTRQWSLTVLEFAVLAARAWTTQFDCCW